MREYWPQRAYLMCISFVKYTDFLLVRKKSICTKTCFVRTCYLVVRITEGFSLLLYYNFVYIDLFFVNTRVFFATVHLWFYVCEKQNKKSSPTYLFLFVFIFICSSVFEIICL